MASHPIHYALAQRRAHSEIEALMIDQFRNYDLAMMVSAFLGFLCAVTVHEYAHARAALTAGDDTAKQMGRVSLNPLDHLDFMGTVMFVVTLFTRVGLAWGKPVPINPARFRNPRWDYLRVSIWGPLSNLLMACALSLVFRLAGPHIATEYALVLDGCIRFNLVLAFFNMLPIAPLDGSKVLAALLPYDVARRYEMTMQRYGFAILMVLIFTNVPGMIIGPPVVIAQRLLIGG
jgi:Zn-dependent protease